MFLRFEKKIEVFTGNHPIGGITLGINTTLHSSELVHLKIMQETVCEYNNLSR
jgi:hypothetical protein